MVIMAKRELIVIASVFAALVFCAGCTGTTQTPDTMTTVQTPSPVQTVTATEAVYAVTEPILVIGDDIYSIKTTVDAKETGSNTLYVAVHYDSSTNLASTGVGSELMATIFAYNYDNVPYDFNPKTAEDVASAGIPYKNVQKVVYPNNKVTANAELPTDSVQGGLNLAMPYNYGAIITKTGTRN